MIMDLSFNFTRLHLSTVVQSPTNTPTRSISLLVILRFSVPVVLYLYPLFGILNAGNLYALHTSRKDEMSDCCGFLFAYLASTSWFSI